MAIMTNIALRRSQFQGPEFGFDELVNSGINIHRTIVDHMEQGVLVYDGNQILAANSQLCDVLDCPPHIVAPGASLEKFIEFGAKRGDYQGGVGLTLQAVRMKIAAGQDYIVERRLPNGKRS